VLQLLALVIAGTGNTFRQSDRLLIGLKFEQSANKFPFEPLVQRLNFMLKQSMAFGSWLTAKTLMPFFVSATSGSEPLLSSPRATRERQFIQLLLFRLAETN
jgi:hypothetical protein